MSARKKHAFGSPGYYQELVSKSHVVKELTAAGYRILAPGEMDIKTLERAAEAVECSLPEHGAGGPQDATDRLIDQVRRQDAEAIRAMKNGEGDE